MLFAALKEFRTRTKNSISSIIIGWHWKYSNSSEYRTSINDNTRVLLSGLLSPPSTQPPLLLYMDKSISNKSNSKRTVIFSDFMMSQLVSTFIFWLKTRNCFFFIFFSHSGESSSIHFMRFVYCYFYKIPVEKGSQKIILNISSHLSSLFFC